MNPELIDGETDFGVDVSVLPDGLDLGFGEITGTRVLLEDAVKGLTTASGVLWWDPETMDVRLELLNSGSALDRDRLAARAKQILEVDPRIRTAAVAAAFDPLENALALRCRLTPYVGASFAFTLETDGGGADVKIIIERTT